MNTIFFTLKTLTYPFVWEALGEVIYAPDVEITHDGGNTARKGICILENSSSRLYNFLIPLVGAGYERLLRMIFKP